MWPDVEVLAPLKSCCTKLVKEVPMEPFGMVPPCLDSGCE